MAEATRSLVRDTRPALRRLAHHVRQWVYRAATVREHLRGANQHALIPPAHLRLYYYRTADVDAFTRACRGAAAELLTRGLQPQHRVLDIGSGIGNLAIGLLDHLQGGFDGLEIHPEAVAWCQQVLTPRHPAFRFHRADLFSLAYNPKGRVLASGYRFPFADRQFDFVFVGSVFTHMLPDEVENYLREIARVLAPGGRCIAGIYLLNDESRHGVDAGQSFMTFPVLHASGRCRLHDAAIPEAAVALEEPYIRQVCAAAGLTLDDVRRGGWWNGRADEQDVIALRA